MKRAFVLVVLFFIGLSCNRKDEKQEKMNNKPLIILQPLDLNDGTKLYFLKVAINRFSFC
jgi:hypothetical protein